MTAQKHVLVADDDPELLQVLRLRLSRIGVAVSTASNGISALAKFVKTPPDLLILDIDMPGADGLKVCEHISRKHQTNIPIIVCTGRSDDETMQRCKDLGARHVAKGPDTWGALHPVVSELLNGHEPNGQPGIEVAPPAGVSASTLKILLIDDDPHITHAMAIRFRQYQVETYEATSGVQGYSMALKHHPDVIVTDYTMPEGGADYMIMRLQQGTTTSQIPVFVLTGKTFGGENDLALRRELLGRGGVVGFLSKPLDFELLVQEIERFVKLPRAHAPTAATQ